MDGLTLDSCQFRGSTAVVISNVTDATLDLCHFYVPLEVTGNRDLVVRGIIFQ
ncbi:MAG: hypothetical protein GWN18_18745, partial [Thermoplasmata archaeon]|nr:hypothetical protein [Thermoplasmata archaeon]NIS14168.1 hypothetical protein [Thermoplasmata archaeon]NIS22007.1 hypothetical protein [Thermoplasmata archaeon]NIT79866.1 hypothetical protein [Thermoplasmata archaeon]NIV80734.1 hypothetical protein [Thermoplasmata archaeon]